MHINIFNLDGVLCIHNNKLHLIRVQENDKGTIDIDIIDPITDASTCSTHDEFRDVLTYLIQEEYKHAQYRTDTESTEHQ